MNCSCLRCIVKAVFAVFAVGTAAFRFVLARSFGCAAVVLFSAKTQSPPSRMCSQTRVLLLILVCCTVIHRPPSLSFPVSLYPLHSGTRRTHVHTSVEALNGSLFLTSPFFACLCLSCTQLSLLTFILHFMYFFFPPALVTALERHTPNARVRTHHGLAVPKSGE